MTGSSRPGRSSRRRALRFVALGLASVLLAGCGGPATSRLTTAAGGGLAPAGQTPAAAPDFALLAFGGDELRLAALRGKPVVLNFWASWCVPCRTEMPYFETTYRAYQDRGVVFVGLAVQDDEDDAAAFLDDLGITYPAGPDLGNKAALAYRVTSLPTTVFVRRDGTIARTWVGSIPESRLVAYVEEIVA